jgi:hypothetical protein
MALSESDLIQILELMVNQLNQNLAQRSITVTVADEAKKWILNQTLTDRSYGARPLRRALQKYIEDPLSEALIQGTITTRPAFIEVFLEGNKLYYRPVDAEKAEGVLLYERYGKIVLPCKPRFPRKVRLSFPAHCGDAWEFVRATLWMQISRVARSCCGPMPSVRVQHVS